MQKSQNSKCLGFGSKFFLVEAVIHYSKMYLFRVFATFHRIDLSHFFLK